MYPCLTHMIKELARDVYGVNDYLWLLPEAEWIWPLQCTALEGVAAGLTKDERIDLVLGKEDEDTVEIAERLGVEALNDFINGDVFDGDLHSNFFRDKPLKE